MASVELKGSTLWFELPEVHAEAKIGIDLQRTLRIPDDNKRYSLPPGLGKFPMCQVDDYKDNVPASWVERGGVMIPMFQSEAMWIHFQPHHANNRDSAYPFAIKIAAGKVSAVTGEPWRGGLNEKDYVVTPTQPWLDGYVVEKGLIRQFVATPLGAGFTPEAQFTGQEVHGGIQIEVFPMRKEDFERRFPVREFRHDMLLCDRALECAPAAACYSASAEMGLSAGGMMKQEIYEDPFGIGEWDLGHSARCFIHIANTMVWRAITGKEPPTIPATAKEYTRAGLPWFDYYGDGPALNATDKLKGVKSVVEMSKEKGMPMLPENESVTGEKVLVIHGKPNEVRQGSW